MWIERKYSIELILKNSYTILLDAKTLKDIINHSLKLTMVLLQ